MVFWSPAGDRADVEGSSGVDGMTNPGCFTNSMQPHSGVAPWQFGLPYGLVLFPRSADFLFSTSVVNMAEAVRGNWKNKSVDCGR